MKIGVIRFPGTNCDRDVAKAIELAGATPEYVWWNEENLSGFDGIVIPGGFSYGDYLRAGAMASITPVIDGIKDDDILTRLEKKIKQTKELTEDSFNALIVQFQYLDVDGIELPERIEIEQNQVA